MESSLRNSKPATPTKTTPQSSKSKIMSATCKVSENSNPNLSSSSPLSKSAKTQKSNSRNQDGIMSPRNIISKRRHVIPKKNVKKNVKEQCDKCKEKCLCVAYESLRASQEEFLKDCSNLEGGDEKEARDHGDEKKQQQESEMRREMNSGKNERRMSFFAIGSGKVLNLVKAFEGLVSLEPTMDNDDEQDGKNDENVDDSSHKLMTEAESKEPKAREPLPSSCSSDLDFTFCSGVSCSSSQRRNSCGSRRSRRNSSESAVTIGGSKWKKKQLRQTSQKPFRLETEQRGKLKEEELMKKIKSMMEEQERLRIPIAQGLPWTTDEPQCLVKPPVKESTLPLNLMLHSDVRAVERAEFDQQVTEKMILFEQFKLERERQLKLAEEEEIRRLRMELVPKAQPMPYFDKPFVPKKRSAKHPNVVPKEQQSRLLGQLIDTCSTSNL